MLQIFLNLLFALIVFARVENLNFVTSIKSLVREFSFLISAWSITYIEWGLGKLLATTEIFVYLTVFNLCIDLRGCMKIKIVLFC